MKRFLLLATTLFGGCHHQEVTAAPLPAPTSRIEMTVTSAGFVPPRHRVKAGQPVTLVITRKTEATCAKEIVIKTENINTPLPMDKAVEVTFTPTKTGSIRFACGMDMITGELIAE